MMDWNIVGNGNLEKMNMRSCRDWRLVNHHARLVEFEHDPMYVGLLLSRRDCVSDKLCGVVYP